MRAVLVLVCILSLAGCKTIEEIPPEHRTIREVQYVVRIPPKELLAMPEKPQNIDVDTASQLEVSEWLIRKEEYTLALENIIQRIAEFLTKEQQKLNEQAATENAAAVAEANRVE